MESLIKWVAALYLTFFTVNSFAQWTLDNSQSTINLVTTKANVVAEVHTFSSMSGTITNKGQAQISIDLSTIDTGIAIRDERMKTLLFEIAQFPEAVITAELEQKLVSNIQPGMVRHIEAPISLSLHGKVLEMTAVMLVSYLNNKTVLVSSAQPLIINASPFELLAGVEKLKAVAGLTSISPAVPVYFHLIFTNK
ncbi:YceI family protein [Endozoicomonas numazuensis]|uniref:Lipid/polyisoprenoid-binding YceI-like domain-containing protein n=1 Tax=Endozoicomonas numazuensis TaxID=1137799 RepID=A0A081NMR2_9GAMM|nr:YceI family protein [Endozoicomonas numazuensis]KEQ19735.1 hypothetical protein GZ78_07645 [Endozoicomonas numazuensis]